MNNNEVNNDREDVLSFSHEETLFELIKDLVSSVIVVNNLLNSRYLWFLLLYMKQAIIAT